MWQEDGGCSLRGGCVTPIIHPKKACKLSQPNATQRVVRRLTSDPCELPWDPTSLHMFSPHAKPDGALGSRMVDQQSKMWPHGRSENVTPASAFIRPRGRGGRRPCRGRRRRPRRAIHLGAERILRGQRRCRPDGESVQRSGGTVLNLVGESVQRSRSTVLSLVGES